MKEALLLLFYSFLARYTYLFGRARFGAGAETAAGAAAGEVAGEAAGAAAGAVAAAAIQMTGNGGRVAKGSHDHRPRPVVLTVHRPKGPG